MRHHWAEKSGKIILGESEEEMLSCRKTKELEIIDPSSSPLKLVKYELHFHLLEKME